MELFFESRPDVAISGKVHAFQHQPEVLAEPVLRPDCDADGAGASIYGSVIADGGIYRMWYQAWPRGWNGQDIAHVAYAESDDGLSWRKPNLGLVELNGSRANNLTNLGLHSPSVFIDPTAPASQRYRATGCGSAKYVGKTQEFGSGGYYTAYSADGLSWQFESIVKPVWNASDVITSTWHPGWNEGVIMLKRAVYAGQRRRRSVWQAALVDGKYGRDKCALVPDAYDDLLAKHKEGVSADYYGMGMMPAGQGLVGFLWQMRHDLPVKGMGAPPFGKVDVTLVYQNEQGGRWLHSFARKDFIQHGARPWCNGCIYTASAPVAVGDEQWLFMTGSAFSHGWYVDENWQRIDALKQQMIEAGIFRIGVARWPKNRLFGLAADPTGIVEISLAGAAAPTDLDLNYETSGQGSIQVELCANKPGQASQVIATAAAPLQGNALAERIRWDAPPQLTGDEESFKVRLTMEQAKVYAFAVKGSGAL